MKDLSAPPATPIEREAGAPPAVSLPVRERPKPGLPPKGVAQRRAVVAIVLIGVSYFLARPVTPPPPDAGKFAFVPVRMPSNGERKVRPVHPAYAAVNAWVSSVGASAVLGDFENSGKADGCIFVDPRCANEVAVAYVRFEPGTDRSGAPLRRVVSYLVAPHLPDAARDAAGAIEDSWAPTGAVAGDFDGDGWTDVMVYYWGRLPVIFRNLHGNGRWEATPIEPALVGEPRWYTCTVCQSDINGDGRPDLVVGNYVPSVVDVYNRHAEPVLDQMQDSFTHALNGGRKHVLLNRSTPGSIRFTDATIEVMDDGGRLSDADAIHRLQGWTLAIGAADLNGDLLPELYIANDFGPDLLLVNETDQVDPAAKDHVRFRLARGRRTFSVPKSKTLGRDSFKGMGVDFTTFGPAGPDTPLTILVSNLAESWGLLESHFTWVPTEKTVADMRAPLARGEAPFVDRSEPLGLSRSGWAWDVKAVDFDNDGHAEVVQALGFMLGERNYYPIMQELVAGNDYNVRHLAMWPFIHTRDGATPPAERFAVADAKLGGDSHPAFFARPDSGVAFTEIGAKVGLARKTVTRGIAVGDLDHDGRLDLVLANQWDDSFAYFNRAPQPGHYVGLRVVRPAGSSPAAPGVYPAETFYAAAHTATPVIGARVSLADHGTPLGTTIVDGGNGHTGRRAPEVHFGVGSTPLADDLDVTIAWREPQSGSATGAPQKAQYRVRAGAVGADSGWYVIVIGKSLDAD